jgi:hypothetical protein
MRRVLALGLGVGATLVVAVACSSTPSSSLAGSSTSDTPGGSGCSPMGTAASDGEGYVAQEGCASCHGQNLAGSTTPIVSGQEPGLVVGAGDKVYPPNLTPDKATGLGLWTSEDIFYAITEGIDNTGLDLCPEMGRHYPNMCPDEANGIVAYLQSIPAVVSQIPVSYCPPTKCGGAPCGVNGDGGS